jgi:hypothetical protein
MSIEQDLGIDWKDEPVPTEDWGGPINEADVHAYNRDAKKAFEAELAAEDKYAGKNAAQIIEEYKKELAEQETAAIPQRQIDAVYQFLVEEPTFVPTPRNQQRIDQYFEAAGLNATDPDHFHQAFRALSSRGLLTVDPSKKPRQPRKQFTDADLYEMPLADLEALANRR